MKAKIYIAGKISGEKMHKASMKFGKAKKQLEALGYEAIHPLDVIDDFHCRWEEGAKKCKAALKACDAVYFLPDYTQEAATQYELYFAKVNNISVYTDVKQIPDLNQNV